MKYLYIILLFFALGVIGQSTLLFSYKKEVEASCQTIRDQLVVDGIIDSKYTYKSNTTKRSNPFFSSYVPMTIDIEGVVEAVCYLESPTESLVEFRVSSNRNFPVQLKKLNSEYTHNEISLMSLYKRKPTQNSDARQFRLVKIWDAGE